MNRSSCKGFAGKGKTSSKAMRAQAEDNTPFSNPRAIHPSGQDDSHGEQKRILEELEKLKRNQPWNSVVRASFNLLSQEKSAMERWAPTILEYEYSQCPLVDGRWYSPGDAPTCFWALDKAGELQRNEQVLKNNEPGPVPLGIVLENVFEVAIRDKWWQSAKNKGERLIPVAVLTPGSLFGAFELCDLQACVPSLRNYEVSAGSRAFKIVREQTRSIRLESGRFYKLLYSERKKDPECAAWCLMQADHDALVRYYNLHKDWKARILLFRRIPVLVSDIERIFLDVVRNTAWHQSRHLREGHLKWLRHEFVPPEIRATGPIQMAVSKFKRKLELALQEECLVFGRPSNLDSYGPFSKLVERMTEALRHEKESSSSKGRKARDEVRKTDILVPLMLHDTGKEAFASLWDDVSVLVNHSDLRSIRNLPGAVIEGIEKSAQQSCKIVVVAGEGSEIGQKSNVDPYWKVAVKFTPEFPSLQCLEQIAPNNNPFENCVIVMAQHLLEETGSLIQILLQIGGKELANRMFVIGKPYSSNVRVWQRIMNLEVKVEDLLYDWKPGQFAVAWEKACNQLWNKVKQCVGTNHKILILDDGGMLHATVPSDLKEKVRLAGVEQTSSGRESASRSGFPVVGVFCSAAKRLLEPVIVADTVWRKLRSILPQACAATKIAVCGLGNIGLGVLAHLSKTLDLRKQQLLYFDTDPAKRPPNGDSIMRAKSLSSVFREADVIFGCTGQDLTKSVLEDIKKIDDGKTRYLVSCSSNDVEFASLLQHPQTQLVPGITPFDLAKYNGKGNTIWLIPQAGFPITFDRAPSAAPIELMQMTRGLLLAGLIQAAEYADADPPSDSKVPLDAHSQNKVVQAWRQALEKYSAEQADKMWISEVWQKCMKWWTATPGCEEDFIKKRSEWPKA